MPLLKNYVLLHVLTPGGQEITVDDRSWLMLTLLSMSVESSVPFFYPTVYPVHDLLSLAEDQVAPVAVRASIERLADNGAYLVENGISLFLYIGLQVDAGWIKDIFDVDSLQQVRTIVGAARNSYGFNRIRIFGIFFLSRWTSRSAASCCWKTRTRIASTL